MIVGKVLVVMTHEAQGARMLRGCHLSVMMRRRRVLIQLKQIAEALHFFFFVLVVHIFV